MFWLCKNDFSPEKMAQVPNVQEMMKYNFTPKSMGQGAATTMYAALSPDTAEGGKYVLFLPFFSFFFRLSVSLYLYV